MPARFRRLYGHLVTTGAEALLLIAGFQIDTRGGWIATFALMAAIAFIAGASAYRRYRAVGDTPTSRVTSAAQGYVELIGTARQLPGPPTRAPISQTPCVWYRHRVERRSGGKWVEEERDESEFSFILDDQSGECAVDPVGAEVQCDRCKNWEADGHRYTEWLMLEGDPVYALGEFRSAQALQEASEVRLAVSGVLTEWKRDQAALVARFDRNGDGQIDTREWDVARAQARNEVMRERSAANLSYHRLGAPADGRPFLISNTGPDALARRYLLWSGAHLAIFIGAAGGLGWSILLAA
jgi:hypothetical protein